MAKLQREGEDQGIAKEELAETLQLARTAHRSALMTAHYEDLRAVLAAWRYLHRWGAVLLLLLVLLHVYYALTYGAHFFSGGLT